nr:hypothetical protein Itr_chr06CG09340 [Ipomoea trifida]
MVALAEKACTPSSSRNEGRLDRPRRR